MIKTKVLIAGGGPAGAAAALSLNNRGIACIVIERSLSPVFKAGETIAPNAIPLFRKLGIETLLSDPEHLISYGNRYVWGSKESADKDFINSTNANGYHLDRAYFECQLSCRVRNKGTEILSGWSMVNCKRSDGGWIVIVQNAANNQQEIFCEFLADATGRSCRIARAIGIPRIRLDQLTGIAACFTLSEYNQPHYTYVEAVQQGWWYAAPLTGNRLTTTFLTDADLFDPLMSGIDYYLQKLSDTTMISDLIKGGVALKQVKPATSPAATSYLEKRYGEGWLAVGDAAFAYDPISSYGITSALEGGYYAGNAIADSLEGFKEALPAYDWLTGSAFAMYKEMHQHQYQLEQRWPDELFWKRRSVPF